MTILLVFKQGTCVPWVAAGASVNSELASVETPLNVATLHCAPGPEAKYAVSLDNKAGHIHWHFPKAQSMPGTGLVLKYLLGK